MKPLKLPELSVFDEVQEQFETAQRRYYRAYAAGGSCSAEREAYSAARRRYDSAVALAQAALRLQGFHRKE